MRRIPEQQMLVADEAILRCPADRRRLDKLPDGARVLMVVHPTGAVPGACSTPSTNGCWQAKPAIIFVDPFAENQLNAPMPGDAAAANPLDARAAVQDLGGEVRHHQGGGRSDLCAADRAQCRRPPGGGAEPALAGAARRRAGARRGDPGAAFGHRRDHCGRLRDHQGRRHAAAAADRPPATPY